MSIKLADHRLLHSVIVNKKKNNNGNMEAPYYLPGIQIYHQRLTLLSFNSAKIPLQIVVWILISKLIILTLQIMNYDTLKCEAYRL